ncbi:Protein SCAI [Trichinella murrelli]|uniref:Protein SCAI n=2 Tax=Trichinella TaxID=6333 RepID=A0A0V0TSG6_9BILA|nr:Protein SCAI [Trichinella murrelli]
MAVDQDSLYVTEHEKEVVNEFCYLLEKSRQLFNGLRRVEFLYPTMPLRSAAALSTLIIATDLQLFNGKHWMQHFFRTFDVFTRLWKFQQQNRTVLNACYGLKRWQIGEIASKIGQLYYHYYVRTSNTAYLLEAYAFYLAIRSRQYFCTAGLDEKPELALKKLRYHARFIVVCLLLKKMKQVRDLIKDMNRLVDSYISRYDRDDQLDWSLVLTEIKTFVEADNVVNIVDIDSSSVIISHRLAAYSLPYVEKNAFSFGLTLTEALVIGCTRNQVTFGEFTLDMYWILQVLEYEIEDDSNYANHRVDSSPAPGKSFSNSGESSNANPRKCLLYKPKFDFLLQHMLCSYEQLGPDSVLLIYISGDGCSPQAKAGSESYDSGGVVLNCGEVSRNSGDLVDDYYSEPPCNLQCLYPGDLYPLLRKPLLLIVESNNSTAFLSMKSLFGQPLIVMCSPVDMPLFLQEQPQRGSIFTMFLHCPLTAYCFVCNIVRIPVALWDKCQAHVDKFYAEASRLLVRSKLVDSSYKAFYSDAFLRTLLLRFLFCQCTLRMHRNFRGNHDYLPRSSPPLEDAEIVQSPNLIRLVLDLACILDVLSAFRESDETVC